MAKAAEGSLHSSEDVSGTSSGADTDSGSDSGSGSSSDSDSPPLPKPVFVNRAKRNQANEISNSEEISAKTSIISKLQNYEPAKEQEPDEVEIDDTDDVDPEGEFDAWRARELFRFNRDRQILETHQLEIQERLKRETMSEQELIREFQNTKKTETPGKPPSSTSRYHKGAFYNDDEDGKEFLKREYVDESVDHSRPTKLKKV